MESEKPHILVVDDDRRLRDLIVKYLTDHGSFRVSSATDAADARQKLALIAFDLIVMDVMMPGESGLELTAFLRSDPHHQSERVPILILTAKGEAKDRVDGLETGADDYLPKPFDPRELVLRIQSILRRAPARAKPLAAYYVFGPYRFEMKSRHLYKGTQKIPLTQSESEILFQLATRSGQAIARDEFTDGASSRLLDVHIRRLRKKIEPDPHQPIFIQTVRNSGYKIETG